MRVIPPPASCISVIKPRLVPNISTTAPVNYEPAVGHFDSSVATIAASASAPVGSYQLVLNATIQNKTKGTILKVAVSNDAVAVK